MVHPDELATDADDTRAETGELRLLAAVLELAVADARAGRADAAAWIASDESGHALGGWYFTDVCAALGVEPAWVRREARGRHGRYRGGRPAGWRWRRLEAAA